MQYFKSGLSAFRLFLAAATAAVWSMSVHAQIVSDPGAGANRPGVTSIPSGRPMIDIVAPNAGGVSHNKFQSFNVDANGVVLNNAKTPTPTRRGETVRANPSLTGPAANVIVNEATGTGQSTLGGETEVLGTKADVIIANPNGVNCNGCSFINTGRATVTTGRPTVNGGEVSLTVDGGTATVQRGGAINAEGDLTISGRHTFIDGPTSARDKLNIYGGSHIITHGNGQVTAAPVVRGRVLPQAVDATAFGAMNGGQINIVGTEAGLGVNLMNSKVSSGNARIDSRGELTYSNVTSGGRFDATASGKAQQLGNVNAVAGVAIGAGEFFLPRKRSITTQGDVTISATGLVQIDGEIDAKNVTISSTSGAVKNTGLVLASGDFSIVAGDALDNRRLVLETYSFSIKPGYAALIPLYESWAASSDPQTAHMGRYNLSLAYAVERQDDAVLRGGALFGRNISVLTTAGIENAGGLIAATNDLTLQSAGNIKNNYLVAMLKVRAADGCPQENCGFYRSYIPGEIYAGNNLTLRSTGGQVQNFSSRIAAYNNVTIDAAQNILNIATHEKISADASAALTRNNIDASFGYNYNDTNSAWNSAWYSRAYQFQKLYNVSASALDERVVFSPASIESAIGDVKITTGYGNGGGYHYFSLGSRVAAGGKLELNTPWGWVVLAGVYGPEKHTLVTTSQTLEYRCWETGYGESASQTCGNVPVTTTTQTDQTKLVALRSEVIGSDISVNAGYLYAPGARILGSNSVTIRATDSLVVDNQGELLTSGKFNYNIKDLGSDPRTRIYTDYATPTSPYQGYFNTVFENPALRSVIALNALGFDAVRMKNAIRSIGVQDYSTQLQYSGSYTCAAWNGTCLGPTYTSSTTQQAVAGSLNRGQTSFSDAMWATALSKYDADYGYKLPWGIFAAVVVDRQNWNYRTRDFLKENVLESAPLLLSDGSITLGSINKDLYIGGGAQIIAKTNVTLAAARDIVVTGINYSTFNYAFGAQEMFATWLNDPAANRSTYNIGTTWNTAENRYNTQAQTILYQNIQGVGLWSTSVTAGENVSLTAGRDIINAAASINASGNITGTATRDIRIEALQLSRAAKYGTEYYCINSCNYSWSATVFEPLAWSKVLDANAGYVRAGGGILLSAGRNIENTASSIASASDMLLTAGQDVNVRPLLQSWVSERLWQARGDAVTSIRTSGNIDAAELVSMIGAIEVQAGRDINVQGSKLSSGGDLILRAANDVMFGEASVEFTNYVKKSGWHGIGYQKRVIKNNDFLVALTDLEANRSILVTAGRDIGAVSLSAMAGEDLVLSAGRDLTLDSYQKRYYYIETGWKIGLTSPAFKIIDSLKRALNSTEETSERQLIGEFLSNSQTLSAVWGLAQNRGKWGTINNLMALGVQGVQLFTPLKDALIDPSKGLTPSVLAALNPLGVDPSKILSACAGSGPDANAFNCAGALQIGVRYERWKDEKYWSESIVSRVFAGGNATFAAGNNVALGGGAVIGSGGEMNLRAGNDLLVSAASDYTISRQTRWGVSVTLSPGPATQTPATGPILPTQPTGPTITVGYDWSRSTTKGVNYTNAQLNAGGDLIVSTGRDAAFMGVNANGRNVYMDVGRDFSLLSLQNWSKSDSRSFNASVSFTINANGVPVPTGFALGGGFGVGRRTYTDTPTTLIAGREVTENGVTRLDGGMVDIYVGRATLLGGSGIWSRSNDPAKLRLNTGVLAFDNFNDVDYARQISGNVSFNFAAGPLPTVSFSYYYKNVQGLTFATVGAGTITTRNGFQDLALLNRDPANMQQVLKRELIDFKLSGVNLNSVVQGVKDAATIFRAYTANVPETVSSQGPVAAEVYRRSILFGLTEEQARAFTATPKFAELVQEREQLEKAKVVFANDPDRLAKAIALTIDKERLTFDPSINDFRVVTNCGPTNGYGNTPCGQPLSQLSSLSREKVQSYITTALAVLNDPNALAVSRDEGVKRALECAMAWYVQGGDRGPLNDLVAQYGHLTQVASRKSEFAAADMLVRTDRMAGNIAALNDRSINYGSLFIDAVAGANTNRAEGIKRLEDIGFRWAVQTYLTGSGQSYRELKTGFDLMSEATRTLYLALPNDLREAIDRGQDIASKTIISQLSKEQRDRFDNDPEYRRQVIGKLIGDFMGMGVLMGRTGSNSRVGAEAEIIRVKQDIERSGLAATPEAIADVANIRLNGAVEGSFIQRYLSETGGRWGGSSTRQQNYELGTEWLSSGLWKAVGGAGRGPEEWISGPTGLRGGTFVDNTFVNTVTGQTVRIQTVSTLADGITPTPAEKSAADRIRAFQKPGDLLILVPKRP